MSFIKIEEVQDLYRDDKQIKVAADLYVNVDQISLIRETKDGISLFMTGRDKAIFINDDDQIKKLLNACKISPTSLNE